MKSQLEIASEARFIEETLRTGYQTRVAVSPYGLVPNGSVQLFHAFPTVRFQMVSPDTQRMARISTLRFILASNVDTRFEYLVHEEWVERGGATEKPDIVEDRVIKTTTSAHEALYTGYGATERHRLAVALSSFEKADQSVADPANAARVKHVEETVQAARLSATDRLRTRADIVDFLQGRLSSRDFIFQTIHRQYQRETERMTLSLHNRLSLRESA